LALSCFGVDCRGGCGLGQSGSDTALFKNNLLPVFVALNLVGIILIKIVIVIIVRREYVSHVIAQCPGRVASTAGTSFKAASKTRLPTTTSRGLGTKQLRDLRPRDIESWHTTLRKTLEPRTVGHAHRVLSKALRDAVTNEELIKNVAKTKTAPKVTDEEMVIVKDVPGLIAKLPRTPIYVPAMIALFTGMRLGEVLALRWSRIDIEGKKLKVEEALEETHQGGSLQGTEVQGRDTHHHVARHSGRGLTGVP
jgi:hypothetical protein